MGAKIEIFAVTGKVPVSRNCGQT